jgi:hypothetical protein
MKIILPLILTVFFATNLFAQKRYAPSSYREATPDSAYASPLFRNTEGTYFDLRNDNGSSGAQSHTNVLNWLQGRVAGLRVYNIGGNAVPYIRNTRATIFLNEMRMYDFDLSMLPVADIAIIKVIRNAFGLGGSGSAIAIYTKTGAEEEDL